MIDKFQFAFSEIEVNSMACPTPLDFYKTVLELIKYKYIMKISRGHPEDISKPFLRHPQRT